MIVGLVILFELLLAPFFRMSNVVIALFQADRRHADFREGKMIRPIKRALLRTRIRRDAQATLARDVRDDVLQRRSLRPERHKVARRPKDVHRIKVDVGCGFAQRHDGVK